MLFLLFKYDRQTDDPPNYHLAYYRLQHARCYYCIAVLRKGGEGLMERRLDIDGKINRQIRRKSGPPELVHRMKHD